MKISIFGMGYVGSVSGACLAELGHTIIGVDINEAKVAAINAGAAPVIEAGVAELIKSGSRSGKLSATSDATSAVLASDVSLISVGTPSTPGGGQQLEGLDTVVRSIGKSLREKNEPHCVIVRSTVLPLTTEDRILPMLVESSGREPGPGLGVAFNPEFLREGVAVKDFYNPPFTVIGSQDAFSADIVESLYSGIEVPVYRTTLRTAEAVKYACNSYHAVKITFANEMGALFKNLSIDSREAMEIFMADRQLNISTAYLRPGFAFGGSCLPKELRAISYLARRHNVELPMLGHLLDSNERQIDRAFELVQRRGRRRIALFGLAFKPNTDDLRESPLVTLAERLLGKGLEISIYDSSIEIGRLTGSNREFIEREIPHLERIMAQSPEEALDGAETIICGHASDEALSAIADYAPGRTIIDLQGVAALQAIEGVDYEGICW